MPGLGDLFGRNGVLEQLFLWQLLAQVTGAEFGPFLTALQQDVNKAHPLLALPPATAAQLAGRRIMTEAAAVAEAEAGGIDAARFAHMLDAARVRIQPADLAEAVLRAYMTRAEAEAEAAPQGITPAQLAVLTDLAGDAIGPQDAARALLRKLIPAEGRGAASVSYPQAIAESRLHDKWGPVLLDLARQLLSPADAASAVVRNFLARGAAAAIAEAQGVHPDTFATMVHLSGDAPGPEQLAVLLRRGAIARDGTGPEMVSFLQGIAEGRLADKWASSIEHLAEIWPTPTDALDAQLKGQITPEQGAELYRRLGGQAEFHDWLLATIGNSPTPLEAAALAARGIIAEHGTGPAALSYDQAVKESRYRNKWGPAYRRLGEHIPPPSTIASFLAHRALDTDSARQLLLQNDMTPQLAAAYIAEAEYEAISDYRGLTQASVIDMYVARQIGRPQALAILQVLHVTEAAAGLLLDYADLRYLTDSINRSVQRISQLFTSRKIGTQAAKDSYLKLGIPASTVEQLIQDLEVQAAANVKTLTEAQILAAWAKSVIDDTEAIGDLTAIGYTPYDAWVVLSTKAGGPLPGRPAKITAPPPTTVIPGVT